jgi:hypothetical protein
VPRKSAFHADVKRVTRVTKLQRTQACNSVCNLLVALICCSRRLPSCANSVWTRTCLRNSVSLRQENGYFGNHRDKAETLPDVVILRLAKRAEGPLKCNTGFLAGSRRNLQLGGPSPSARFGMTPLIASIDRLLVKCASFAPAGNRISKTTSFPNRVRERGQNRCNPCNLFNSFNIGAFTYCCLTTSA